MDSKQRQFLKALAFAEKDGRPYVVVPAPPRGNVERWIELPLGENWQTLSQDNARLAAEVRDLRQRASEANRGATAVGERMQSLSRELAAERTRCAELEQAIQRVLAPVSRDVRLNLIHGALRQGMSAEGYHSRDLHPWWSPYRWLGCRDCVPGSFFVPSVDLEIREANVRYSVFDVVHSWACGLLKPVLKERE